MSRIHVTACIALSALTLAGSTAFAQTIFGAGGTAPTSTEGTVLGGKVEMCQGAPGGSRMRQNCEAVEPTAVRAEVELRNAAAAPSAAAPSAPQCEATTLTEYSQRGSVARVAGTVSIANCPAGSAGTFDIVARIKDESGETKPVEFAQTWQRDDTKDVSFTGDYPIGDNVELVNVRVRNLKCTCAEAAGAAPAAAASTEPPPN
jgi:hypothetical protein